MIFDKIKVNHNLFRLVGIFLFVILMMGLFFGLVGAAVNITATKTDTLVVDNDGDGEADPGDVISYTIIISNTGNMDAENVLFTDTIDANTTLVGGSLSVSPIARDDSYDVLGNVGIDVSAANGLIDNNPLVNGDDDPDGGSVTVTAVEGSGANVGSATTTSQGGSVTVQADGSFTYDPPPGYEGPDSFDYEITDNEGGTDPATVTFTVSGMIWFVDTASSAGGDGTLADPFDNLAGAGNSFDNLAADDPGDSIFVADGNYTCGLTLLNNQRLIGDGSSGSLATIAGVTVPPFSNSLPTFSGTDPILTSTNADCITLASGNTVRGLTVGNTGSGVGITDNAATVGSLTISEVTINGTGGGIEVDNGGTLAVSLDNLSASSSSDEGIDLEGVSGSFAVVGTGGTINTNGMGAIVIDGNPSLNINSLTFQSVSAQNTATGILIQDTTGSFIINGTGTTGGSGGTIQNITQNGIELVNTQNITLRNMNLTNANTSDGGGVGVCDGNTNAGCNGAINMDTVTNVNLNNVVINGAEETGINGRNVTNFDLVSSTVQNAGNAVNEGGLHFDNLFGTATISDTTVSGSAQHNIDILNDSGTLTLLTVRNSTIQNNSAVLGADGMFVGGISTAVMNVVVEDSTFNNNQTDGIQADVGNTAQMDFRARRNSFTNGNIGLNITSSGSGDMTFEIDNNTAFTGNGSFDMNIFAGNSSTMDGEITNNDTVTSGEGVIIEQDGNSTLRVLVDDNTFNASGFGGALTVRARDGSGRLDATITDNVTTATGGSTLEGIFVDTRNSNTVCANIQGNTASSGGSDDIVVEKATASSTFILPGILSPFGAAQAETLLSGQNTVTTVDAILSGGTFSDGTCNLPVVPVVQTQPQLQQEQYVEAQPEPVEQYVMSSEQAALSGQRLADSRQPTAVSSQQSAVSGQPVVQDDPFTIHNSVRSLPVGQLTIHNFSSKPAGLASPLLSGENFSIDLGTLNPDQVVTIEFQVTIDDPISESKVCNQGEITGDGITAVTDDPDTGTADDPTCTTIPRPDLTATKTNDTGGTGVLGVPFIWTITISNSGAADAIFDPDDVILTDTLPINADYGTPAVTNDSGVTNSGNISCSIVDNELGCTASGSSVTIGSSGSFDVVFTVTPTAVGDLVNPTGGVCKVDPANTIDEDNENNNDCTDTVTIEAVDLQISKTDGGFIAVPGGPMGTIVYTLTFTNAGDLTSPVTTTITDTLPANTTFNVGASTGGSWNCAGSECALAIGSVSGGAGGTVNFAVDVVPVVPAGVTQIENTVEIGDDGSNGPDANPADNTASDVTPVNAAPDLQINKDDGGISAQAGETISYTLTYTNAGNQDAAGVVLTETVPANTSFNVGVSDGDWDCPAVSAGTVCTFPVGDLAGGGTSATVAFAVDVDNPLPDGLTQISNTAQIGDEDGLADQDSDTTPLLLPDLTATKTNDTGGSGAVSIPFNWTINISNSGAATATFSTNDVILRDNLPLSATYGTPAVTNDSGVTNSGNISCDISSNELECTASGGSVMIGISGNFDVVFEVTPTAVGDLVNPTGGVCKVDPDLVVGEEDGTNNECSDTVSIQAVDLQISKDDGGVTAVPGATIVYTLTYTNNGNLIANNTFITETVPANTKFNDDDSTGGWSCPDESLAGTTCLFPLGSLPGGSGAAVAFAVDVVNPIPAGVEQIENTVMIGDDGSNGPDANPADNTASDVTPVNAQPDLVVVKDDADVVAFPGGLVTYTITISNVGNQDATGVILSDTVPANTVFSQTLNVFPWNCGAPTAFPGTLCTLAGVLGAGDPPEVIFYTLLVTDPLPLGVDLITNTVELFDDGSGGPDANPDDNTATDETEVRGGAIQVEKATNGFDADTAPGPNIPIGDPVVWTYEIENTGNVPLSSIQLDDDQLPPFTCDEGAIPDLDPGESFTCTTSGVASPGQYENQATVTAQAPAGYEVSDLDPSHYFGIDPMNWSFQCVEHRMEVFGIGMGNPSGIINPQSLTLNDPASVNWMLAQMSGRARLPDATVPISVAFSTDAGQSVILNAANSFTNDFGYSFETTLQPTGVISVEVTGTGSASFQTPRALALYANRTVDFNTWTSVGRTTNGFVYRGWGVFSHSEVLDLLPLAETTNLTATAIYIDNNNDSRPVVIEAEAGGVFASVTHLTATDGDLLNIVNLTLPDVPAGTDAVTITIRSPQADNGDSASLMGVNASYVCDSDRDNDTILNNIEGGGDPDGDKVPNYLDIESDGDGILDSVEWNSDANGDNIINALDRDADQDGTLNFLDLDSDGDGLLDEEEGLKDENNNGILDFVEIEPGAGSSGPIYLPIITKQ